MDCSNPICEKCDPISPDNEHNLEICVDMYGAEVGKCLLQCGGQPECEQNCNNQFTENFENCPCQVHFVIFFKDDN